MPPDAAASPSTFCIGSLAVSVPLRPAWVMGILNVTPDSFSDGGEFFDGDRAVARGLQYIAEGVRIIDVGAESTRPGSSGVQPREQIRRAVPVIERLHSENPGVPISIDTTSAEVAREAIGAGAEMVNDTSALRDDPAMAEVVAKTGVALVLMHRRGTPADMQQGGGPTYANVVAEISEFLGERIAFAVSRGVDPSRIVVDPGLGFGKRVGDNLRLLAGVGSLAALGRPVVVGASRKKFIGEVLDQRQPRDRTIGSVICAAVAAMEGASILRVHDALETAQALTMVHAMTISR